jgi:predicted DNA binding protein
VIEISIEMEQYDCPFIDTTADHDISFSTFQWEFDKSTRELETRMVAETDDRAALDAGLETLREHRNVRDFTLLKRWDDVAHIRTVADETDAMGTIRGNGGYIRGPFYIEDGTELWHIGFDSQGSADRTLSDLERNNEFAVVSRRHGGLSTVQEVVKNADAAMELIESCHALSDVEVQTLTAAVQSGYFESPRQTTLGELAEDFDISKPALSKNLRRAQQKVLEAFVTAVDDLDGI